MLLVGAMIWGFAFAAQDIIADSVGVFTCGAVRSLIATVVLSLAVLLFDRWEKNGRFLFSRSRRPLTRGELLGGVACGTALAVASAFQQAGIGLSGASKGSFITALYVVLVPLAGAVLFHRRIGGRLWLSVVIAIVGLGLIRSVPTLRWRSGMRSFSAVPSAFARRSCLSTAFSPPRTGCAFRWCSLPPARS